MSEKNLIDERYIDGAFAKVSTVLADIKRFGTDGMTPEERSALVRLSEECQELVDELAIADDEDDDDDLWDDDEEELF